MNQTDMKTAIRDKYGKAASGELEGSHAAIGAGDQKTLGQAMLQIILADISMSLDNVLAVAGAASEHPTVLIIGLVLSVGLMGAAATVIANLLKRFHWIAYVGLAVILWVALDMIWRGSMEVVTEVGVGDLGAFFQ